MNASLSFGIASGALVALSAIAFAAAPQMGGPMEHIMVHRHGSMVDAHVHDAGPLTLQNYGESYAGAAAVLNGLAYNAQYGWMVEGFWSPPAGSVLWIEQTSATAGLQVFSGGTMMNMGTFEPIFGTSGSSPRIQWNGAMLHNWYAAAAPGTYTATYSIYFGDAAGNPTPGYQPGSATLSWELAPPAACAGDANGDQQVDGADLSVMLAQFGHQVIPGVGADFNADGIVDGADLSVLLSRFGQGC